MTMQTPGEIRRDLPSDLDEAEREALVVLAMRLQAERPVPRPAFRGDLRRELLGAAPRERRLSGVARPRNIRVLVASYIGSGLLLLGVAAIGLAGTGPFAT
jgi:hypothetical protein